MYHSPLFKDDYSPQFSGHETFPLRYGWLKKVFDRVSETEDSDANKAKCWGDDAIARFGVGKNMVGSMRHWAKSIGIVEENVHLNSVKTTELGRMIFGSKENLDPYLENSSTLWLLHWQLSSKPVKTTWFWAFNHFPSVTFDREAFVNKLESLSQNRCWNRTATTTIKNDVACFIRTYVAKQPSAKVDHEDALESPLTELGLIKPIGKKDGFRFVRGSKQSLKDGMFVYALMDFWKNTTPSTTTLSFEAIAYSPGSPGRVFLLEENDVVDRLVNLEKITGGELVWSETAGLKQVIRNIEIDEEHMLGHLSTDYNESSVGVYS